MNEIKKSLIETAGDMSDSKHRVRMHVLHHQKKKQDVKKNILASMTVIATIALFFVITSVLMKNEQKMTQGAIFDEELFETSLKLEKVMGFSNSHDEEYLLQETYDSYEKNLAFYTYALSLGYKITDSEIEQRYKEEIDFLYQSEETKKFYHDMIKSANISIDEYEEYLRKKAPYRVAQKKLEERFKEKYPKIDVIMANSLAQKNAIPYFRENYTNEIQEFKEKHNLPLIDNSASGGGKVLGRVVGFEDNMFLVVPSATIKDVETLDGNDIVTKYNEGYWIPQDGTPELEKGDLVEVTHSITANETVPYVTDIEDLKIIEDYEPGLPKNDTIKLVIPSGNVSKVKGFVGMLNWEDAKFEISQSADYEFNIKDVTYQIWSQPDGFVLVSSKDEYRKLNDEFTEELSGYLGLD